MQALAKAVKGNSNSRWPLAENNATQLTPISHRGKILARGPFTYSALPPARPSVVFDTYWQFAATRQAIFFKRLAQSPPPWTNDPILQEYKFTNTYRASDRVSQFLIRHVIYEGDQSPAEVFFRIMLFKLFNKIETWGLLTHKVQTIAYDDYSFDRYDRVLSGAIAQGQRIYSAAYIMPSGQRTFSATRKHRAHLKLLERMMDDELPYRLAETRGMFAAFTLLRSYPMIGDFLAYQYVTDMNYSKLTNFSEMEFVVPGPGARAGIYKCFESLGGVNERDIIKVVTDRQEAEFERLGLRFESLWGRPLQLIDCQNLFCEVDKYACIKHPEIVGVSGRTRIKQKFRPNLSAIEYWYPPKWGLNEKIMGGIPPGLHSNSAESSARKESPHGFPSLPAGSE
jgi:5-hmdU DNA kinase, helical domain